VHERADVIVVPGLAQSDRGLDGADAHDAVACGAIHQHEHVARVGEVRLAGERRERALDAACEALAVGRQ
jgi:hypothetical protein